MFTSTLIPTPFPRIQYRYKKVQKECEVQGCLYLPFKSFLLSFSVQSDQPTEVPLIASSARPVKPYKLPVTSTKVPMTSPSTTATPSTSPAIATTLKARDPTETSVGAPEGLTLRNRSQSAGSNQQNAVLNTQQNVSLHNEQQQNISSNNSYGNFLNNNSTANLNYSKPYGPLIPAKSPSIVIVKNDSPNHQQDSPTAAVAAAATASQQNFTLLPTLQPITNSTAELNTPDNSTTAAAIQKPINAQVTFTNNTEPTKSLIVITGNISTSPRLINLVSNIVQRRA